ncbi:hypothetical protein [Mammaliicoccus sciuri]|uniref:hypothetical protein n=1 Tax=Mammaliicoccus sciuri TaxID=1296 RepID=UPI003F571D1B
MGLFSKIDKLLSRLTEDETEKWLRFHDDLDKRYAESDKKRLINDFWNRHLSNQEQGYSEHRKKWDWYWKSQDEQEKRNYPTGGLQDKPSEAPIPTTKLTEEIIKDRFGRINPKPWLQSLGETYYVVERNNRYVDDVVNFYTDSERVGINVSTTDSLLECYRYDSREEAQEFADKYDCNVRKVIVKVEE